MDAHLVALKIEYLYLQYGYPLVFFSSFIETSPLGWTIPGGLILAIGGFFAYESRISLCGVIVAGWLGQWLTFMLAYLIGSKSGFSLIKFLHQEMNAKKAKFMLDKHGGTILTTSMLSNLTRFWVAYLAGVQSYNVFKFIFYSAGASLTWTSFMVMSGYIVGTERKHIESVAAGLGFLSWILIFISFLVIFMKSKKEFKQFTKKHK